MLKFIDLLDPEVRGLYSVNFLISEPLFDKEDTKEKAIEPSTEELSRVFAVNSNFRSANYNTFDFYKHISLSFSNMNEYDKEYF